MELLDLSASFSSLPLPRGNHAAIMTLGGGWGVVTSDLCSQFGLEVSELTSELIERFDQLLPTFWSRSNPIDLVGENDPSIPITVLEELLKWDGCDAVINLGIVGQRILVKRFSESVIKSDPNYSAEFMKGVNAQLTKFERNYIHRTVKLMEKYQKPVYGVSLLPDKRNQTVYRIKNSRYKGIFYPTPERAVKAFAKMHEYQCFLNRNC
jgi:acyl-CoA synthetase (NDP forming)